MLARVAPALALAVVLAGCLSPSPPGDAGAPADVPSFVFVDPIVRDHNHSDPAEHALATPTMRLLAYSTLDPAGGDTLGVYGEIDVVGALGVVAVSGMGGETPGFVTMDLSRPDAPHALAFTPSAGTGRLADVKIHPGGKWLLAAAQSGTVPKEPDASAGADGGPYSASQNGLRLYDIADPTSPRLAQWLPSSTGYGCHMVAWKTIGGTDWLFCVGRAIETYAFDPDAGRLELRGLYAPQDATGVENLLANDRSTPLGFATETRLSVTPHDATVQDDPLTGEPLLVVSWWDLGLRVVSVADPERPRELGGWAGEGAGTFEGNVHSAMLTLVGGKRVLVSIPELLRDDPAAVWVLDATDYGAMKLLGEWVAPGRPGADGLRFSTHNIQVANERLYMAFYHAGVWVLDLARIVAAGGPLDDAAATRAVLGYYLPHADVPTYLPREAVSVPDVWDVVLKDGYLYASDMPTGLYVLHYLGDDLGDAEASGFA